MAKIDPLGPARIQATYEELSAKHRLHLSEHGVKMPSLLRGGHYTFKALILICLYRNLGQPVTKEELTKFVTGEANRHTNDLQPRHLATQDGWNILLKQNNDRGTETWPAASYGLVSIEIPKPFWSPLARDGELDVDSWGDLLDRFQHRCATCGSREGEPNLRNPASLTVLQRGHCDPNQPITVLNCIPQCIDCNRGLRSQWIWDATGRPRAINDPRVILQSPEATQLEVLELLRRRFGDS
jgi:hypothetical protein